VKARRGLLGAAGMTCVAAAIATGPGMANASTAYRYWAYYVAQPSGWQFSQRGPTSEYPVDGEVQGWRFAVQAAAGKGLAPRAAPDFQALCGSTPAHAGQLRVGVVIDFGVTADAPPHERPPSTVTPGCVRIPVGGSGADVLQAAAQVRIGTGPDGGLVCGIDGYPKTECAAVVEAAAPKPSSAATVTRVTAAPQAATPIATQPSAPTTPDSAGPASGSPAALSAAAPSAAAPSAAAPSASAPSASAPSASALSGSTAPARTLASLRSATRPAGPSLALPVTGAALVIALGAVAVRRARAGPR
jgi:hypothetical protein